MLQVSRAGKDTLIVIGIVRAQRLRPLTFKVAKANGGDEFRAGLIGFKRELLCVLFLVNSQWEF